MATKHDKQQLRITHLKLQNWRNFKNVDIDVAHRCFVFGPNASGKSNLLDAFRFLRDLTVDPGGLQYAVRSRGGMGRVRALASRNNNNGAITVGVSLGTDGEPDLWEYEITFSGERKGEKKQLPAMIARATKRTGRQVISTTHAWAILDDEGLGLDEVLVLSTDSEGTSVAVAGDIPTVRKYVEGGAVSLRDALHAELIPPGIGGLKLLDHA